MDKVLVVDDDAHVLEVVVLLLEAEGLAVLTAGDGLEALTIAQKEQPRLVLADIMMPRMDGVELCSRLRGDPSTSAMVVLLMSAAPRADASGCGAAGVIQKPFDLEALAQAVHRYLGTV